MQCREPFPDRDVIDLLDVWFFSLSGVWVSGCAIIEELREIAFIVAQRVRAHVTLVSQMVEELSEKLVEHPSPLYTRSRDLTKKPLRARTRALGRVLTLTAMRW